MGWGTTKGANQATTAKKQWMEDGAYNHTQQINAGRALLHLSRLFNYIWIGTGSRFNPEKKRFNLCSTTTVIEARTTGAGRRPTIEEASLLLWLFLHWNATAHRIHSSLYMIQRIVNITNQITPTRNGDIVPFNVNTSNYRSNLIRLGVTLGQFVMAIVRYWTITRYE